MRLPLVLLALLAALPLSAQQGAEPPHVVVTGHAEVAIAPDRAVLLVAVETRASTAAAAGAASAQRTEAVRSALERGTPLAEVHTAGYTVHPNLRVDGGRQRQDGYTAVNLLRVETGEVDGVGALIDAALAAGADRIQSVQFTASDPAEARRNALGRAIAQARRDAEAMAEAAGASLGPLVELSTERFDAAPGVMISGLQARVSSSVPTSITPGELTVQARVLTRWRLVPRG